MNRKLPQARVAAGRKWVPQFEIHKTYRNHDGTVQGWNIRLNGIEMSLDADRCIRWMEDSWEYLPDMERAGWVEDRCFGPGTYNHTSSYLAVDVWNLFCRCLAPDTRAAMEIKEAAL